MGSLRNSSSPSERRGICVIMAGGRGTRFWPLSRTDHPKQLLALASGRSLLRDTFDRVEPLVGADRILVVTSGSLGPATRAELPELPAEHVITEPVGRNTAPCAVLGMGLAGRIDAEAPVALLPADHFIPDDEIFRTQLAEAYALADDRGTVVTLGIPANRPETGFGYLEVSPRTKKTPPPRVWLSTKSRIWSRRKNMSAVAGISGTVVFSSGMPGVSPLPPPLFFPKWRL